MADEYNWLAVRMLAVAVLELAIEDYRTLTPNQQRVSFTGRGRARRGKCRWTTAYELLADKAPGPGKMTMLEFLCQLVGVEKSVVQKGVLNSDIWKREGENCFIRTRQAHDRTIPQLDARPEDDRVQQPRTVPVHKSPAGTIRSRR